MIMITAAFDPAAAHRLADRVTIDLSAASAASFSPAATFGAGIDGGGAGEIAPMFTSRNLGAMAGAGLQPISYRLRTELAIEAWHWSVSGSWSDPERKQGYWTGDAASRDDGPLTYGYKLPRRGDTNDEANNDGYSRLDDGDPRSFWKSNPYLDRHYTGALADHPEWVVIELDRLRPIDTMEIVWAEPFARHYVVQYWVGKDENSGRWIDFQLGHADHATGGKAMLTLAEKPVPAKFIRVLMLESSGTGSLGTIDIRDRLGFAIFEIGVGTRLSDGVFSDVVRHGPDRLHQSVMHVSSTDPWHRAIDRDAETEQPSPVRIVRSGLAQHLPIMIPVGILYDTPENAVAELQYFRNFGVPLREIELGEEPDGQLVTAADYAALYLEFARRIHNVFPAVITGGPSLMNGIADTWLDDSADQSWTSQFIRYLSDHDGIAELGFFSFEMFPFDDMCGSSRKKLLDQSRMMGELFQRLDRDGVPRAIPWAITEYGFSAFAGHAMVELPSALLNSDMVADFLTRGGKAAYLYGYNPNLLLAGETRCAGHGNMMLWQADKGRQARWAMPTYYAARMLTQEWVQPGVARHILFRATTGLKDGAGNALVTAYPVRRPDRRWAIMLINRSDSAITTRVHFDGATTIGGGQLYGVQYSARQYSWHGGRDKGHPARDLAPRQIVAAGWGAAIRLPHQSITVMRGNGPN
jgi:hypothetical protein